MKASAAECLLYILAIASLLLNLAIGPSTRNSLMHPVAIGKTFEARLALGCYALDLDLTQYDLERIRGISSVRASKLIPVLEKQRSASNPEFLQSINAIKGFGPVTARAVKAALMGDTPGKLVPCPELSVHELREK